MQTNNLDISEFADLLTDPDTRILDTLDFGSTRMHVAIVNNLDVLVFADLSGAATIVYSSEAFDDESAGSVHDHCRAIAANA